MSKIKNTQELELEFKEEEKIFDPGKIYKDERKLNFVAEFYADLEYDKEGRLVIAKGKNLKYDSKLAVKRCLRAISEKKVKNTSGTDTDVGCDTICVHSDTPNAVEIIKSLKKALKK